MDTLKHGDSGLSVEQLQTALSLTDLTRLPRLTVDGQFNALTVGCVMEFQSLNSPTVDGVVGPQTNGRLPLAPSEASKRPVPQQVETSSQTSTDAFSTPMTNGIRLYRSVRSAAVDQVFGQLPACFR